MSVYQHRGGRGTLPTLILRVISTGSIEQKAPYIGVRYQDWWMTRLDGHLLSLEGDLTCAHKEKLPVLRCLIKLAF